MNRRSFIGQFTFALAGFSILPAATHYNRIWIPDRRIITSEVESIWQTYSLSYESTDCEIGRILSSRKVYGPKTNSKFGSVVKYNGRLWYSTGMNWCLLRRHHRPIPWKATTTSTDSSLVHGRLCWNGDVTNIDFEKCKQTEYPSVPMPEI